MSDTDVPIGNIHRHQGIQRQFYDNRATQFRSSYGEREGVLCQSVGMWNSKIPHVFKCTRGLQINDKFKPESMTIYNGYLIPTQKDLFTTSSYRPSATDAEIIRFLKENLTETFKLESEPIIIMKDNFR